MTQPRDLDGLIGAWAGTMRLTDGDAAAIADAIVGEPRATGAGLPPNWWRDFSLRMSGIVVRAAQAGSGAGFAAPVP